MATQILVVDDDVELRDLLRDYLASLGYVFVPDGEQYALAR